MGKGGDPTVPSQEELELRAEAYAGEGMLGKATAVFKGERPSAVTPESTADMMSKHPQARASEAARCALLRAVSAAAAPIASGEELRPLGVSRRGRREAGRG